MEYVDPYVRCSAQRCGGPLISETRSVGQTDPVNLPPKQAPPLGGGVLAASSLAEATSISRREK